MPLNQLLRRLAALCFLGGLVLYVVFVPSAHNPADAPSRGVRPRRCPRGACRQSRLEELLECQRLAEEAMDIGVTAAHVSWTLLGFCSRPKLASSFNCKSLIKMEQAKSPYGLHGGSLRGFCPQLTPWWIRVSSWTLPLQKLTAS